ncbi:phospholipase D-like domain-containing protein [Sphingobium sp. AN641]|uniref:phospholipase D-like domain-containing protein n=1 Tax=Sphingobium sp. AN641 TaxID=3133443 RepID=UPI0030BFBDDA
MSEADGLRLHLGGPHGPPRHLRNLLRQKIDAVPAGGEIVWATYYFRDRDLAQALLDAHRRGVRVILHIEGRPRRVSVNMHVIKMLRELGSGLHIHAPRLETLSGVHPHLHSKIYYFSHPAPSVLVGSFNPSGDVPEDSAVIAEIGDQDRGHNLLVELFDPAMVNALRQHVEGLDRPLLRLRADQNRLVSSGRTSAWFYPRLRPAIIDRHLATVSQGARIEGAISHLKKGFLVDGLIAAARRGVDVRILVHDTERRVPGATVAALAGAGIEIARYVHPERLPLHAKFLLIDEARGKTAYFGSFNYNPRSRYLNHEILLASRDPALHQALSDYFGRIRDEGSALD